MKHYEFYRIPDEDDMGCQDSSSHLLVNSAGYYEFESFCRANHRIHGRRDYYLAYNYSCPMRVRIKEKMLVLAPGSMFLYRPYEEQYYGHENEKDYLSYWVHFTGYGVEELLNQAGLSAVSIFNVGISSVITDIYEQIIDEIRDKKPGYELVSAALLSYLISIMARRHNPGMRENISESRKSIYKSINYIQENYHKNLLIRELAADSHLSTDRYYSLFKEITGMPPRQYIVTFRFQKACELMKRTSLNIRQISAMVGFHDQLYFSKLFKKYKNITPSEYMGKAGNGVL